MPVASFSPPPLHWAADLGLDRPVARLIEKGAHVNRKDTKYNSPPVGWALYGRYNSPAGSRGRHRLVLCTSTNRAAQDGRVGIKNRELFQEFFRFSQSVSLLEDDVAANGARYGGNEFNNRLMRQTQRAFEDAAP